MSRPLPRLVPVHLVESDGCAPSPRLRTRNATELSLADRSDRDLEPTRRQQAVLDALTADESHLVLLLAEGWTYKELESPIEPTREGLPRAEWAARHGRPLVPWLGRASIRVRRALKHRGKAHTGGESQVDVEELMVLQADMRAAGCTQTRMAAALGVSRQIVNTWLQGRCTVPRVRFAEMRHVLGRL